MGSRTKALLAIAVAAMVFGCATMSAGPTPAEEVMEALADFQAALKAQDVEKAIDVYSDDFAGPQGVDKYMVRSMFEGVAAQGMLQSVSVVGLDQCEILADGDSAKVEPLIVESPTGRLSYRCEMKKEADGAWRIVNADVVY